MSTLSSARPARGTRPTNRRDLILDAATELFATRGYENVNVSDVAAEVTVGPSALYRHFRGKESLLEAVIARASDSLGAAIKHDDPDDTDLETIVRALATAALDNRALGALWQREARHLPPDPRARLEHAFDDVRDQLALRLTGLDDRTSQDEGRIRAVGVLGLMLSPSFRRVELPPGRSEDLLSAAALRAIEYRLPTVPAPPTTSSPKRLLNRTVRREVVLGAALDLFAEASYASVSMEDIAAAAGMATSSVYLHFPSKVDLLSIALSRGNGYLQLSLDRALHGATDEGTALRALITSYCNFVFAHPGLVELLITETRNLPSAAGVALTQAQRDYVQEWVHLHRALQPDLSAPESTVVVQGVLMLMNDLARLRLLRSRPDAEEVVAGLATAALLGGER